MILGGPFSYPSIPYQPAISCSFCKGTKKNIQLRERLDSLAQNRKGDHFMKVKVNSDYFI